MNQQPFTASSSRIKDTATTLYIDLLEDSMPLIGPARAAPDHRLAVRALVHLATELGHLKLDGPWHLSSTYNHSLTHAAGFTPQGGWHGLAGLLVGAHLFHADRKRGFIPQISPEELITLSADELQQRLTEGFLRYYTPPTTMAGLLMILGVHPSWGLRLVYEAQRQTTMATHRPWYNDQTRFPQKTFEAIQQMLVMVISALFDVLLALDHQRRYRIDRLAHFTLEACALARTLVLEQCPHCHDLPTPLFILQLHRDIATSGHRVRAFINNDLFEHYLIPAGVVRRFDDQTFCVNQDALHPSYRLHHHGTLAEGNGLAKILTQNTNAQRT